MSRSEPHSTEVEAAMLGAILTRPKQFIRSANLTAEMFYYKGHSTIYESMCRLHAHGQAPEGAAVLDDLKNRNLLPSVGGSKYIHDLAANAVTGANVESFARQIQAQYTRRQLIRQFETSIAEAQAQEKPLSEVLDNAARRVYELTDRGVSTAQIMGAGQLVASIVDPALERLRLGQQPMTVYDTGIDPLNEAIGGGYAPGDLITLAAQPKKGKSRLSIFQAASLANTRIPVGYMSLDMRPARFVQYLGATLATLRGDPIQARNINSMDPGQLIRMGNAAGFYNDYLLTVCSSRYNSMSQIESYCRKFKEGGAVGVYIDQVQRIAEWNEGLRKQNRGMLEDVVDRLKTIGEIYELFVVMVHQLRRDNPDRPTVADLKETGAFEERSDIVLILDDEQTRLKQRYGGFDLHYDSPSNTYAAHKPKGPPQRTEIQTIRAVELQVAGQRGGAGRDIRLLFDYALGIHTNPENYDAQGLTSP